MTEQKKKPRELEGTVLMTFIEPIGVGEVTYGPFNDEIDASEFMDDHGLSDSTHKIVVR